MRGSWLSIGSALLVAMATAATALDCDQSGYYGECNPELVPGCTPCYHTYAEDEEIDCEVCTIIDESSCTPDPCYECCVVVTVDVDKCECNSATGTGTGSKQTKKEFVTLDPPDQAAGPPRCNACDTLGSTVTLEIPFEQCSWYECE